MIRSDAGRCPVSAQCGILGVAKSTCYWVLEHPEAERADPYEKDVERVWRDSGKVYGARKIRHALEHEGVTLSRRRVNRIMKGNGMAGSCSKAAYRPRPARPDDDPAPCFASMFVRQVRQCFSVVWADGFPRCRHRFPVM